VESLGIPSISLVTEQFRGLGTATAKGRRVADLPIMVVPHLYDQWPEEKIREDIRNRLPEILDALVHK
jgi:hypothetical protein